MARSRPFPSPIGFPAPTRPKGCRRVRLASSARPSKARCGGSALPRDRRRARQMAPFHARFVWVSSPFGSRPATSPDESGSPPRPSPIIYSCPVGENRTRNAAAATGNRRPSSGRRSVSRSRGQNGSTSAVPPLPVPSRILLYTACQMLSASNRIETGLEPGLVLFPTTKKHRRTGAGSRRARGAGQAVASSSERSDDRPALPSRIGIYVSIALLVVGGPLLQWPCPVSARPGFRSVRAFDPTPLQKKKKIKSATGRRPFDHAAFPCGSALIVVHRKTTPSPPGLASLGLGRPGQG